MSVGSLSGVSFGTNGIMRQDDALTRDAMASYGPYSTEQIALPGAPPEHKKGSFLGGLVKLAATAVIVGGAAIAARKTVAKDFVKLEEITKDTKFVDKAKHYFAKSTDWLSEHTYDKIAAYAKKVKAENKKALEDEVKEEMGSGSGQTANQIVDDAPVIPLGGNVNTQA